ncbi:hypothetical protein BH10ACT3_BH10ACT3_00480 [soil metagenome]
MAKRAPVGSGGATVKKAVRAAAETAKAVRASAAGADPHLEEALQLDAVVAREVELAE